MREASIVRVYPSLVNSWTKYEQLVKSRYASTKRAEIEVPVLSCMSSYHVYKNRRAAAVGESFETHSKEPTNASVRYSTLLP